MNMLEIITRLAETLDNGEGTQEDRACVVWKQLIGLPSQIDPNDGRLSISLILIFNRCFSHVIKHVKEARSRGVPNVSAEEMSQVMTDILPHMRRWDLRFNESTQKNTWSKEAQERFPDLIKQ